MFRKYYSKTTNSFYPEELKEEYIYAGSWQDDAVVVSEEVFSEFTSYREGLTMVPDEFGLPSWGTVEDTDLSEYIKDSLELLDKKATEARHRYVSPNKSATYLNKAMEAEKFLNGDSGTFPYLTAESEALGIDIQDLATSVMQIREVWVTVLDPIIESTCIAGKDKIRKSISVNKINVILKDYVSRLEEI